MMTRTLILGSTSPYRRELMERLKIPFTTAAPDIDETRLDGESARDMVLRLSLAKARKVAEQYPDALIIGSDQCAVLHDAVIGKPGNHDNAVKQLQNASGQTVAFLTGLCLFDSNSGHYQLDVVPFSVDFCELTDAQINHYLHKDQPYNCAGSFRSESLGITLFKRMYGDDPTALMGLPLIRLSQMLQQAGIDLLG